MLFHIFPGQNCYHRVALTFLHGYQQRSRRILHQCLEPQHPPHHEVFSASRAGHLDSRLRRFIYRPDRLAERYVKPGDRVLDFGCGPGFFTREFVKKAGDAGIVIAVDLQEEMLQLLREKLEPEGLMPRIRTHQCVKDTLGLSPERDGSIDIAFAIFVVHEVPDARELFREISSLLVPGGLLFLQTPVRRFRWGIPEHPCKGCRSRSPAG